MGRFTAGIRVQRLLEVRGINQSALAELVESTPATISRIVSNKTGLSVRLANEMASKTGVRAGWLLTGELPMFPGQDIGAVARDSYMAGWRDAVSATMSHLRKFASAPPSSEDAPNLPEPPAGLGAARRNRRELEEMGRVPSQGAGRPRRQKRA